MHPCPVCHDKDQSARVTALVRAGTSNTSGSGTTRHGGSFGYSGGNTAYISGSTSHHYHESQAQTDLAKVLALNLEDPPGAALYVVSGLGVVLFPTAVLGNPLVVSLVFLLAVASVFSAVTGDASAGCGCTLPIAVGLVILLFAVEGSDTFLMGLVYVVSPLMAIGGFLLAALEQHGYDEGAPERERKHKVWSELFYCSRDDLVFHPESGQHAPVGDMHGLIDRVEPPRADDG